MQQPQFFAISIRACVRRHRRQPKYACSTEEADRCLEAP